MDVSSLYRIYSSLYRILTLPRSSFYFTFVLYLDDKEMKKIIYRSDSRGGFQNEWLNTKYSFSFADYFDRNRMNFGALRVVNDDIVQPAQGFGKHPHDNMEIITIPISGALSHRDSMGHQQEIGVNEVQVMSAGTGIFHSEFNASPTDEASLLQIWIYPHTMNIKPRYDQQIFETENAKGKWQELVSGNFSDSKTLHINQNAIISRIFLIKNESVDYHLAKKSHGSFIFVIEGEIEVDNARLGKRDSIGISETEKFELIAISDSFILNIEVPEYK
jgi:redox-sensitive bicupin YhaK (pirin superfamily)